MDYKSVAVFLGSRHDVFPELAAPEQGEAHADPDSPSPPNRQGVSVIRFRTFHDQEIEEPPIRFDRRPV